ncbi:cell division protein FtsQ/DivIB [Kineococcus sp. SYSU DK003]|uniref:cell division protein FtsQ/DivIB n=1 Tax=Kineococcus sp. SYSU DK003 TaxID=3383124 RepID=UPI003D7E58E4
MARPTPPRRPAAAQPPVEPKVTGSPQRRRAVRAAGHSSAGQGTTGKSPGATASGGPTARTLATGSPAGPSARSAKSAAGTPAKTPGKGAARSPGKAPAASSRRAGGPSAPASRTGRTTSRPGERAGRVADLAGARRARRWQPGRRAVGALVALAVVLVAGGWLLLASPWLRVSEVRITGVERTDVAAVQAIVAGQEGVPLARVGTRSLTSAVEELPLVASVDVSRSWPSTLVVAVTEREAVAAVGSTSGGVDLVDGDGNVLVHEDTAPAGVPTLDVDVASAGNEALQAAIEVNATLAADVRSQVSSIAATGPDAVTLQLVDGPVVVWGDASRPERKAEVLLRLLADPTAAEATTLDVSAPDAPAATP